MIRTMVFAGIIALAACSSEAQDSAKTQDVPAPQIKPIAAKAAQVAEPHSEPLHDAQSSSPNPDAAPKKMDWSKPLTCVGQAVQGGALLCRTYGSTYVTLGGTKVQSDGSGQVILGFDRDAPSTVTAKLVDPGGHSYSQTFDVKAREWDISRIDGLPKNQVSEYTAEELKRIRAATARKKIGFASQEPVVRLTSDGFESPVKDYIKTTNFGAQRILNGIKKRPHYGVDMAAPAGTPITAPADGVVSLADMDMYFEGSLIMIDHGQGLISYYMHMQDVLVEPGQIIKTGDVIGKIGTRGRSTGPHLCWRLKWRGQNLDPELLTKWPDQVQLSQD
ncbi:M23 family metallopeptidase [Robiginitomaculum antarcticum]|uniref:M23 family metallopeptidase n=1 Tax=Robiginitomaculum antarcticum TaxID=437507 RepID=UPI00037F0B3B|nr:M23 family metallopeptidase [Robiginitomaculum antarcticum]